VPSDSTLYRTFRHQLDNASTLAGLWEAMSEVRAQVWARSSVTNNDRPVILDIDATLVEVHSENKEGTAATYKRGQPCGSAGRTGRSRCRRFGLTDVSARSGSREPAAVVDTAGAGAPVPRSLSGRSLRRCR
jgi:hypothetical protein